MTYTSDWEPHFCPQRHVDCTWTGGAFAFSRLCPVCSQFLPDRPSATLDHNPSSGPLKCTYTSTWMHGSAIWLQSDQEKGSSRLFQFCPLHYHLQLRLLSSDTETRHAQTAVLRLRHHMGRVMSTQTWLGPRLKTPVDGLVWKTFRLLLMSLLGSAGG